jgi:hypothetical protein
MQSSGLWLTISVVTLLAAHGTACAQTSRYLPFDQEMFRPADVVKAPVQGGQKVVTPSTTVQNGLINGRVKIENPERETFTWRVYIQLPKGRQTQLLDADNTPFNTYFGPKIFENFKVIVNTMIGEKQRWPNGTKITIDLFGATHTQPQVFTVYATYTFTIENGKAQPTRR